MLDSERITRIVNKLEQVRTQGLSCFGSESHGFQLNPPASAAALDKFEREQRVQLPSDYRAFLQLAGNGGAGPYYGLFQLHQWDDFISWTIDDFRTDLLSRPCPLYPDIAPTENWADEFGDVSPYQGTLSLGTRGCTYAMQLIVSGKFAGRVVYVDADGSPPYVLHEPDFLAWYERWLDELLGGYETNSFGFGPAGGEVEFFRILEDSNASDRLQAEAAYAFCRLPKISVQTQLRVPELLRHRCEGVRAGVCATIRKFELRPALDDVARLLVDPSSQVRNEAVRTLMTLDQSRWSDSVLRLLRQESDTEVATTAFFRLKDADALTKCELVRIIEQSPLGNLRGLAAHAGTWTNEDLSLLVRMLSDPNEQVRFYASLGLRQLNAQGL